MVGCMDVRSSSDIPRLQQGHVTVQRLKVRPHVRIASPIDTRSLGIDQAFPDRAPEPRFLSYLPHAKTLKANKRASEVKLQNRLGRGFKL